MWALSSTIRERPFWWEKVNDDAIMEIWKQEALEQQKGLPKARALTERMVRAYPFDFAAKTEMHLLRLRSTTPSQNFSLTPESGRETMGLRC